MKFSEGEIIIIGLLHVSKIATTKWLAKVTGYSEGYIRNVLVNLRRKNIVRSMNTPLRVFFDLPVPNSVSSKEAIHQLNEPLERIFQYQEFQQKVKRLLGVSRLEEFEEKFAKFLKRRLSEAN